MSNNLKVLNVKEVSEILGISKSLTYDLVKQGEIPHKKLGRRIIIPNKEFESWLANVN